MVFYFRLAILSVMAAFSWLLFGLASYGLHVALWDVYYGLFWFSMAMMVAIMLDAFGLKMPNRAYRQDNLPREEQDAEQRKAADLQEQKESGLNDADKLRVEHGLQPSWKRKKQMNDRENGW